METKCTTNQLRPQNVPVLVALEGDGYLSVYGENISVHIANVPYCPGEEVLAEETFDLLLPWQYRQLYLPNLLKAHAMHKPLLPSSMKESKFVESMLSTLDRIDNMAKPTPGAAKAAQKSLARARRAAK